MDYADARVQRQPEPDAPSDYAEAAVLRALRDLASGDFVRGTHLPISAIAQWSKLTRKEIRERLIPAAVERGLVDAEMNPLSGKISGIVIRPPEQHRPGTDAPVDPSRRDTEQRTGTEVARPRREERRTPVRPEQPPRRAPRISAAERSMPFPQLLHNLANELARAHGVVSRSAGAPAESPPDAAHGRFGQLIRRALPAGSSGASAEPAGPAPAGLDGLTHLVHSVFAEAPPAMQAQLIDDVISATREVGQAIADTEAELHRAGGLWQNEAVRTQASARAEAVLRSRVDAATADLMPLDEGGPTPFQALLDGRLETTLEHDAARAARSAPGDGSGVRSPTRPSLPSAGGEEPAQRERPRIVPGPRLRAMRPAEQRGGLPRPRRGGPARGATAGAGGPDVDGPSASDLTAAPSTVAPRNAAPSGTPERRDEPSQRGLEEVASTPRGDAPNPTGEGHDAPTVNVEPAGAEPVDRTEHAHGSTRERRPRPGQR